MLNDIPHKVLLPQWIFEQAKGDKEKARQMVFQYMIRYPNYRLIKISGSFAICERIKIFE